MSDARRSRSVRSRRTWKRPTREGTSTPSGTTRRVGRDVPSILEPGTKGPSMRPRLLSSSRFVVSACTGRVKAAARHGLWSESSAKSISRPSRRKIGRQGRTRRDVARHETGRCARETSPKVPVRPLATRVGRVFGARRHGVAGLPDPAASAGRITIAGRSGRPFPAARGRMAAAGAGDLGRSATGRGGDGPVGSPCRLLRKAFQRGAFNIDITTISVLQLGSGLIDGARAVGRRRTAFGAHDRCGRPRRALGQGVSASGTSSARRRWAARLAHDRLATSRWTCPTFMCGASRSDGRSCSIG